MEVENGNCMNDTLSAAGLLVEGNKATEEMQKSISNFASFLICPLCNKIFDRPATLSACAHTFCTNCVDGYSANNSVCPAKGCGMPMSIVGSNGGSFRKINLQISQTIESLQFICKSLNQSKEHWWRSTNTLQSIQDMRVPSAIRGQPEFSDEKDCDFQDHFDGFGDQTENEEEGVDDEEMIDLQAIEEEESCVDTGVESDEQETEGYISDDESM
mmetsp:Transcript_33767/g.79604  ORF Transcript_33767/g.79604 Transcript_33767/m.79604 type:complete len:215 (+) Transcript_33767:175-819(+)